ncbi:NAD(P)-dependent oxidoreductase [Francisella sp. 19X1-34]|uniref:NAD(P)-dependent oxidoreductase n=1 Tax=Francisella sp. 19X1-34 TaxID=3087177 RepID=UPI002E36758C|nr:NAD(P)-dependent oxidoreductase [Francisella sp. 19X1-34]MED7787517.1 NAD(P)-dependent oxidoreductase [Francisella sp. 19X1-34]
MVVGSGQLAEVFYHYKDDDSVVIFASGVSNSNCTEQKEFDREGKLLEATLKNNSDKKFVYFSSCALSVEDYPKNKYYQHKQKMETLIENLSDKYYIFRVPQLFGNLKLHNTLINYIYNAIENNNKIKLYSDAYRYVIEIEDVKKIVDSYLLNSPSCSIIDVANPYRYKVLDIIKIFEGLLNKQADITVVDRQDKYVLDLSKFYSFIETNNLDIEFGEGYLKKKLYEKIEKISRLCAQK